MSVPNWLVFASGVVPIKSRSSKKIYQFDIAVASNPQVYEPFVSDMQRNHFLIVSYLLFAGLLFTGIPGYGFPAEQTLSRHENKEKKSDFVPERYVSVYWAKNSPDRFLDILTGLSPEFRSSYLVALIGGAPVAQWRWIRFEFEGQGVLHTGMQDHLEINAVIIARWMNFPWDRWIDTRMAFGEGLSYAFQTPPLEPRSDPDEARSARLLNYLMVELEVVLPGHPRWSTFVRLHHRSGAGGFFFGVSGGSNFVGAGIRHTF